MTKGVYICMRGEDGEKCPDRRATDLSNEQLRQLIKEAQREGAKEWLDEKFTQFGRWTARAIFAAALFALVTFLIKTGQLKP